MAGSANPLSSKVSLDVTDFKTNSAALNRELRLIESGFQASVASMGDWSKNSGGLEARIQSLGEKMGVQAKKVEATRLEYEKVAAEKGANSRAAQELEIKLNKETETLGKMQSELRNNQAALEKMGTESGQTAREVDKLDSENKKAEKSTKSFGDHLKDLGKGVASTLSGVRDTIAGIGKAAGVAIGGLAIGAAVGAKKLVTGVIEQFGSLEQSLGGSEAVFQEYASTMQKIGEDAYKNMGVSQSQYLDTANKMGALFQGTGLTAERSADITAQAMQRAADMASVMGIDMQMALDSVAGAAKGNFTMMDNLGVAMNATTIEAYAAANGLDFVWASATQAEKAEMAMKMFFETTEQYAGNFAKESTQTIRGSMGLLTAAVTSWTAGLGNSNADMINLTENVVDAFGAVVDNVVPVLENITDALPKALDTMLPMVGNLLGKFLPVIVSIFSQIMKTVVGMVPQMLPVVVDSVGQILETLIGLMPEFINLGVELVLSLIEMIGEMAPMLAEAAPEMIMQLVDGMLKMLPEIIRIGMLILLALVAGIGQLLPSLIPAAVQMIVMIINGLTQALPQLMTMIATLIPEVVIVLIENLPLLIDAALQLILAIMDGLVQALPVLINYTPQIIEAVFNALIRALPMIGRAAVQLVMALVNGIGSMLPSMGKAAGNIIGAFTKGISGMLSSLWQVGADIVNGIWNGISAKAAWFRSQITGFFSNILSSVKAALGIKSPSKLFADEVGSNIALGIWQGFDQSLGRIKSDMDLAVKGLTPELALNPFQPMTPALAAAGMGSDGKNLTVIVNTTRPLDYELLSEKVARKLTRR
jgi:phage-related protein